MTSPNISNIRKAACPERSRGGFTMIEILVVVTIFIILAGLGLLMSFNSYGNAASRSERDMVVSLLEQARSRSMNNMNQTTWGVCYLAPNYVVFRGTSCTAASPNELTPANPNALVSFSPSSVVFTQLSGNTIVDTVTITQNGHTDTISINSEGMIDW